MGGSTDGFGSFNTDPQVAQALVDLEAWGWKSVELNDGRQSRVARFLKHIPGVKFVSELFSPAVVIDTQDDFYVDEPGYPANPGYPAGWGTEGDKDA